MRRRLSLLVACVVVAASCGGADDQLVVSAAASLTDAFVSMEEAFEQTHDIDVVLNFGGSSALREQIRAGAPADVFASASASIVDELLTDGLIATAHVFASNRLVLGVPAGNPAGVASLGDLARPELLVGLCADPVPCGVLAHSLLEARGVDVRPDTKEPDARALATKLGLGELDAALVYATDARQGAIDVIDIDGPRTDYAIAILTDAKSPTGAAAFVEFVRSAEGQALLADEGFTIS